MSDKRSGKKIKRAATLSTPASDGPPAVVSDLTQHPAMMKKKSK